MFVLGIETSCDETSVALYDSATHQLHQLVHTQTPIHQPYGGVIPELASRDHSQRLLPLIDQLLIEQGVTPTELSCIAYTAGPGLAGPLLVGAGLASALSYAWQIPCLPIHHLEAHLLIALYDIQALKFPFLALLVSGGHTHLFEAQDWGKYRLIGATLDDAAGECFDKTAKILGLGYPGGPALSQLAQRGDPKRFRLPRPLHEQKNNLNFSFSGLKTAAARQVHNCQTEQDRADLAASLEQAIVEALCQKLQIAQAQTGISQVVVAGGVSANRQLRLALTAWGLESGCQAYFPKLEYCTDNAAMVAFAGYQRRMQARPPLEWALEVKPRWTLEDVEPFLGTMPNCAVAQRRATVEMMLKFAILYRAP